MLCKERLLICGDFNIHVDSVEDPDSVKFRDLLESVGLREHVKKSAHNNGQILDLIITRFTDSTICKEPQVDRFISDHASVICHVLASRPSKARRKITYRKLKSADTDKLRRDVAASILCNTVRVDPEDLPDGEINNLVREYNLTLKNITDYHAPLKTSSSPLKFFELGHLLPGKVPRLMLQKDAVAKLRGRGGKTSQRRVSNCLRP